MFWFVKTVHLYSAGPESKIGLSYVNVVCVYDGREGGGVRGIKMFCHRGSEFFLLALCVGGGGGGQVQYLSFREKNNRPPHPINK